MDLVHSIKARCVLAIWKMTPNCKEMTRLASQTIDSPPTVRLWLKTRMHFLICAWCERYWRQLRFLHENASRLQTDAVADQTLSPSARDRIKHAILHRPE
jgi:hypothetical protein